MKIQTILGMWCVGFRASGWVAGGWLGGGDPDAWHTTNAKKRGPILAGSKIYRRCPDRELAELLRVTNQWDLLRSRPWLHLGEAGVDLRVANPVRSTQQRRMAYHSTRCLQ